MKIYGLSLISLYLSIPSVMLSHTTRKEDVNESMGEVLNPKMSSPIVTEDDKDDKLGGWIMEYVQEFDKTWESEYRIRRCGYEALKCYDHLSVRAGAHHRVYALDSSSKDFDYYRVDTIFRLQKPSFENSNGVCGPRNDDILSEVSVVFTAKPDEGVVDYGPKITEGETTISIGAGVRSDGVSGSYGISNTVKDVTLVGKENPSSFVGTELRFSALFRGCTCYFIGILFKWCHSPPIASQEAYDYTSSYTVKVKKGNRLVAFHRTGFGQRIDLLAPFVHDGGSWWSERIRISCSKSSCECSGRLSNEATCYTN